MYIRKKIKILLSTVMIMILGIGLISCGKVDKSTDVKSDAIVDNENVKDEKKGAYLELKDDPNADDASIVIPSLMYPGVPFEFTGQKIAYLTFDDGPSEQVTGKILDILKKNNVKATFFTLGKIIEENPKSSELIKRMATEGHAIANHGYSHDYNVLYPNGTVNVDSFMKDFKKNDELLKGILGNDFKTRVIRLPGGHGSWNGMESLDKKLAQEGIYQTDWNALNGDAEGASRTPEKLLSELKNTVGEKRSVIVLMHDTDAKETTAEYLQSAIDYLKSQGFVFKTLK